MKNRWVCLLLALALVLASSLALAEEKLQIVTVNFPCYDTACVIAGDRAEVSMLLPPGSESHSYEPTPADIVAIQEADLFFYVGGESDSWVESILESMGKEAPLCLRMSDCVALLREESSTSMQAEEEAAEAESEEEMDEHVWTSPVNMMAISRCLAEQLVQIDPEHSDTYTAYLEGYLAKLTELDSEIREVVANGKRNTLIFADRFPFLYFVKEYGLSYDAAFPGCSEDSEPSVRTVISLIDTVQSEGIPVVFYIEFSSRRTADIVVEGSGAKALLFHSCHNVSAEDIENGVSYLSLMENNLTALKEALN